MAEHAATLPAELHPPGTGAGLVFATSGPAPSDPNRADVALFVGFVRRRLDAPVPAAIRGWLVERGWREEGEADPDALLDVPVPITAWDTFDRLFAWEDRPLAGGDGVATTYLGAAVRSFFAQGGRMCYLVRAGNPWPLPTPRAERVARLARLIPGFPDRLDASPAERATWHGVAHLFGLTDVSFLCLPDLADAVAVERTGLATAEPSVPDTAPEVFVECSTGETEPRPDDAARLLRAPRCDEDGYRTWATALGLNADLIARAGPEVQLLAAVPIPEPGSPPARDLAAFLTRRTGTAAGDGPLAGRLADGTGGLASAFVQLAYPWARTPGSANLPERLESPDAVLAGVLARNALARGTFRSAGGASLGDVYDLFPPLGRAESGRHDPEGEGHLPERVSLLGPTPGGLRVLSDVTTSLDPGWRPAAVNRLVAAVLRAARRLGEDATFEPSGERLWARVADRLEGLLASLLAAGALRGATPAEAFVVRCDRSTMTQADLDAGRVVATVQLDPATPIGRITVVLALTEGGRLALRPPGTVAA